MWNPNANICGVLVCFLQTTTSQLEFEYAGRKLGNELTLGKSMALNNLFNVQVVWRSETICGFLHLENTH